MIMQAVSVMAMGGPAQSGPAFPNHFNLENQSLKVVQAGYEVCHRSTVRAVRCRLQILLKPKTTANEYVKIEKY